MAFCGPGVRSGSFFGMTDGGDHTLKRLPYSRMDSWDEYSGGWEKCSQEATVDSKGIAHWIIMGQCGLNLSCETKRKRNPGKDPLNFMSISDEKLILVLAHLIWLLLYSHRCHFLSFFSSHFPLPTSHFPLLSAPFL